jgi:hypothetical protein
VITEVACVLACYFAIHVRRRRRGLLGWTGAARHLSTFHCILTSFLLTAMLHSKIFSCLHSETFTLSYRKYIYIHLKGLPSRLLTHCPHPIEHRLDALLTNFGCVQDGNRLASGPSDSPSEQWPSISVECSSASAEEYQSPASMFQV